MSGFIHPQWSGFGPPAAPQPVSSDVDRQPSGLEIERTSLGRPAEPAAPPVTSPVEAAPVTPASSPHPKA